MRKSEQQSILQRRTLYETFLKLSVRPTIC